jgi:hypothetical protein
MSQEENAWNLYTNHLEEVMLARCQVRIKIWAESFYLRSSWGLTVLECVVEFLLLISGEKS